MLAPRPVARTRVVKIVKQSTESARLSQSSGLVRVSPNPESGGICNWMHDISFFDNRIRATVAIATFCPVGSVFYGMDGNLQARGSAPPQSCVYERIDPYPDLRHALQRLASRLWACACGSRDASAKTKIPCDC